MAIIALFIAVLILFVAVVIRRPGSRAPIPPRVVVGDSVQTEEGLSGTVTHIAGTRSLVRSGAFTFWATTSLLQEPDGAQPPSIAPPDIELQEGELPPDGAWWPTPDVPPELIPLGGIPTDAGASFLSRFAHSVYAARRAVIWGWIIVALVSLPFSSTAHSVLKSGGYIVKGGAVVDVQNEAVEEYGIPRAAARVIVPGTTKETNERIRDVYQQIVDTPHVSSMTLPTASTDKSLSAFTINFSALDQEIIDSLLEIRRILVEDAKYSDSSVMIAGTASTSVDVTVQAKEDLAKAEMIGLPLAMIVLLLVFRSVIAALLPLLIGTISVIVTLAILHVLALPIELSVFVMNIASMLGFGLGIDYALLGVTRFRQELAGGATVASATHTTIVSASRATAISGFAVLAGMLSLAVIPLGVMMSIAIGGAVVVAVTVLASITLLPALLGVLGQRIEKWSLVRKAQKPVEESFWYATTSAIMRKPVFSICIGVFLLATLAAPLLSTRLDVPHEEVLSEQSPSRVASSTLESEFDEIVSAPIFIILDSKRQSIVDEARKALKGIPHIAKVTVMKHPQSEDSTLLILDGGKAIASGGQAARATAKRIDGSDLGASFRQTGIAAGETEFLNTMKQRIPYTVLLTIVSTFVILCLMFRSIAIPLKAIVLDLLSLGATFGIVKLIFQDGYFAAAIGAQTLNYMDATLPIILFCVLFGLTMDYEVFMLAKVTELYQRGEDGNKAVAIGVASTAPLVTGAAAILIMIGLTFALTELVLVKQIGMGMAVALVLDATIVRLLILPATMRALGAANWWMPVWMRRRVPRSDWASH